MHNKMILGLVVLVLCPLLVRAEPPMMVSAVDVAGAADHAVVTIRCSATPNISSFVQNDPPMVVVDLVGAQCAVRSPELNAATEPIARINATQWRTDPRIARVAIELTRSAPYAVERVGNDVQVKFALRAESPRPPVEIPEREFDYAEPERGGGEQQLVTMIVKEADVASILQLLAAQFSLNILTTADVKGTVTFQFTNVPLQTALDALAKAAQCNFVKIGDVIVVKPIKTQIAGDMETRVFNLDYAEADDIRTTIGSLSSSSGNITVSYRRVGDGNSSKRASVLLVTDFPENLAQIEKVIQEVDQPVPQVSIEAKFIETTINNEDLYGIDWTIRAGWNMTVPARPAQGGRRGSSCR